METSIKAGTEFASQEFIGLLKNQTLQIENWKWIALALLFVLIFSLRPVFIAAIKKILASGKFRTERDSYITHLMDRPLARPLSWILLSILGIIFVNALGLTPQLGRFLENIFKIFLVVNLIRLISHGVDALGKTLEDVSPGSDSGMQQLVPFATKSLKALVFIMGVLIALENFGINVMGLMAGLGLGGLALALAAQDTAANLFGSVTLLFDKPFVLGDWVKIGETEGVIEELGFRSTRIRTLYNSLVSIPNSVVAKERIDNMGARTRRRVRQVLGLTYNTAPEKILVFCQTLKSLLEGEKNVDPKDIVVTFNQFAASSLDVLVQFHLREIPTSLEEQNRTQEIFCRILMLAQKMEVEFAFPTTTVYSKVIAPN